MPFLKLIFSFICFIVLASYMAVGLFMLIVVQDADNMVDLLIIEGLSTVSIYALYRWNKNFIDLFRG